MPLESSGRSAATLSAEQRKGLRQQVTAACQPVAQSWPLKTFAYRNPIRGFEHLPFDQAVREAKRLLGGSGYLSNEEYRRFYGEGRITDESVQRALRRVGPSVDSQWAVSAGSREIFRLEVVRSQLLSGIDSLEASLLTWTLNTEGVTAPPHRDLWTSSLAALGLEEFLIDETDGHADGDGRSDAAAETAETLDVALPALRTLSDWLETLTEIGVVDQINGQMMKWTAAFLDEGLADWQMPARGQGFYEAWRQLAPRDISCRFLGIKNFSKKIRELPDSPEEVIALCMNRLEVPADRWQEYQSRHFAQLAGWTGFVRWLDENPEYPGQHEHPIDLVQYLAVRLFYEAELVDVVCRREWGIPGTLPEVCSYWQKNANEYHRLIAKDGHSAGERTLAVCRDAWRLFQLARRLELASADVRGLSPDDVRTLLGWLDAFPPEDHGPVWLEAYEDAYREMLVGKLRAHGGGNQELGGRPRAQLIFCIDARSEPFRRHIESQGPYETFGFAGFFGVPMSHQAFDSADRLALCPVLLKPSFSVRETAREGQQAPVETYASGTRWQRFGDALFHDLKANPISSYMLIDVMGLLFSIGLIGKTLIQKPYRALRERIKQRFANPVQTRIQVDRSESGPNGPNAESVALATGFSLEEQVAIVGGGLRVIGLTKDFGRLVVVCGHGSVSDNNPYAAAYNCGACGGSDGDPNARVFAAMANNPDVRRPLKETGLTIPEDVWFLAARHDTTTDRLTFYDVVDLPTSHAEDFRLLKGDVDKAGAGQALERLKRLPRAPRGMSAEEAYTHAHARGDDWANVRPEWGLSSNAAFVIGRRRLTAGLSLDGRAFLNSYDPESDADGGLLEKIMTAPLIVGQWINSEYYFSAVDPWVYGSGTKVLHNVVSGVGVMLGSQSDIRGGLPLQSVNDGAARYHEPMRLLAVIEAPTSRISSIIQRHAVLQQLFHNQWVNLLAVDPTTYEFHRYNPDSTWEPMPLTRAA